MGWREWGGARGEGEGEKKSFLNDSIDDDLCSADADGVFYFFATAGNNNSQGFDRGRFDYLVYPALVISPST